MLRGLGLGVSGRVAAAVVSLGLAAGFVTLGAGVAVAAAPPQVPTPADSRSAADEATARALATKFGHEVVVDSSVTSTNQVSALPDGSLKLVASSVPVRAKVGSAWKPIDLSLTSSGGYLVPSVSTQAVQFSLGGDGPLARVRDSSGAWIAESSPFGSLPRPTVKGSTAIYADVLPSVDLHVTATATGMSEVLVVKTAAAAANPQLAKVKFGIVGSAVTSDGVGNAHAGAKGDHGVRAGTPLWWDSSQGSTAAGPGGTYIPQPVGQSVSSDAVTLDAGAAATTDGVQYPVYIDPDWSVGDTHAWFIDAGFPNQAYLDSNPYATVEKSGWIPASASGSGGVAHTARAFWNFNLSALVGTVVSAAHLNVVLNGAFNCRIMRQANLRAVAGAPIGGTWNSSLSTYYGGVEGSAVPGGCGTAVGFSAMDSAGNAVAGATSQSMAILANSESDEYNWQKWNMGATFTATYDHTPAAPTSPAFTSPSRSCSTSQTQPTFIDGTQPITISAHTSDPDAGQNLTTSFTIYGVTNSAFSTTTSTASQSQGTASVTVAANALGNGEYSWNSKSSDGTLTSAVSAMCYFQVETTPPGLPTVTPTSGTPTVGGAMTFTLGSVPADNVQLFAIWWVDGLQSNPSSTPATTQVTPGSALPACGSSDGGVRYICPDAGSHNATGVVVAPIDHLSTLMVASFDQSARISLSGTQVATAYQVTAAVDTTNVGLLKGHLWDPAASNITDTSVPDLSESTDTSGNSAPQPLDDATLTTSTFLGQPDTVVFAGGDPVNPYAPAAHTESGELDASGSFTISVWVNFSSGTGGGMAFDQIDNWGPTSGDSDTIYLNFVGANNNEVNFCTYPLGSSGPMCATGGLVPSDTWTLVTAVRDKVNHQLRVYLNGSPTPTAEATVQDFAPVASGIIIIGGGFQATYNGYFNRPAVFPGVISSGQLTNLYAGLNPNNE